jgi:N-terminal half of MaoC dehydratase
MATVVPAMDLWQALARSPQPEETLLAIERFPIEAGHIMCFARAIGDANPAYYGSLSGAEPVPAPPTFVQASAQFDPDYPLRPKIGEPWFGSGREASGRSAAPAPGGGGGGTGLHAEQHYEYHRPLRAGDVLTSNTVMGGGWEKQGRRGGRLVFSELITEYRDAAGELVVTARTVAVKTEKIVEQGSEG